MTDCARLEQLGTPPEVTTVLSRIQDVLAGADICSAILTGSSARGELSYCYDTSGLVLRSDVELYVVTEHPGRTRRRVRPMIAAFEHELRSRWPGFHIDMAFLSPHELRTLRPYIRHFELKHNGLTLVGQPLTAHVPDVGPLNLDWCELNDTIMWRLVALVCAIRPSWLAGETELPDGSSHALARNVLDVTLWALPGLGVFLPTFRARLDHWRSARVNETLARELPSHELLDRCFRARREQRCSVAPDELLGHATAAWGWAYDVAVGRRSSQHRGAALGFSRSDRFRRARFALRAAALHPRLAHPIQRDGYAAVAARAALHLVFAAQALRGRRDASRDLARVCAALRRSRASAGGTGASAVGTWAALRLRLMQLLDRVSGRAEWEWRVRETQS